MSEERSIYGFGNAGISILKQEIVKRDAELASLRRRADQAEADNAALRQALEYTVQGYGIKGSGQPALLALAAEHPGAALQSELVLARAIVTALRMHRDAGGEVWHSIDADLAAYDAAKAGGA